MEWACQEWRCKTFVLSRVNSNGGKLKHAHAVLQSDSEIVTAALRNAPGKAIHHAEGAHVFEDAYLQEIMAVTKGHVIKLATKAQRDELSLVLLAVKEDGECIKYVSRRLRGCQKVIRVALANCPDAIRYVPSQLKMYEHYARWALMQRPLALKHLVAWMRNDLDVVRLAIKSATTDHCAKVLTFASPRVRCNPEFARHLETTAQRGYIDDEQNELP